MKTYLVLFFAFNLIAFSQTVFSQKAVVFSPAFPESNVEIVAVKPIDALPVEFVSQEDLDNIVPSKIKEIKEASKVIGCDEFCLQKLREELWRYENAIVQKKR